MSDTKKLKIAFLTSNDSRDKKSYSGTHYYMGQALIRNGFDVTFIGPLTPWEEFIGRWMNKLSRLFLRKKFRYLHTPYLAKRYARMAEKKMKGIDFDFIYAPAASKEIAFLKTTIPIIYTSDCTWGLLNNYYSKFSDILPLSVQQGHDIEKLAVKNASLLPYPGAWVANSAVKDYGGDEKKISIIPWGANMDEIPSAAIAHNRKRSDECRLFFLGVHWQRKGGDIALQTLLELERMGVNAHLTICGCVPPQPVFHPRITVIPYLSKKIPEQKKQLEQLFEHSDFLLLPTRAECWGIVFSEAASYGLPVISTDTGGVNGVVKEGASGFLLPLSATGTDYAELIQKIYGDEKLYSELVKSSRAHYENEINYDTWAQRLKEKLFEYQSSYNKSGAPIPLSFGEGQGVRTEGDKINSDGK